MTSIQDIALHLNQIKKLVASKTPTGRASKTDIKSEMLLKIFLKAKNTNNTGYQKFSLGYFRSLGCERTVRSTLKFLESLGYISKKIKTIISNKKFKRILYIKLELENIATSPKEIGVSKTFINGKKYMQNNSSINGKKLPLNRENNIYEINYKNTSNTLNDSSSNSLSDSFNDTLNDSSNITNILTNLNHPEMPFYTSTPIKHHKPYIQKINISSAEAELVGLMGEAGVSYTDATIASMLKYFSTKNITFDSKRKLKAYTQKLISWLVKIQTSFNDASVSVSTLPTYYDEKYNSFAYQSKDILATQELLNKVNISASTNHTQEILKTILRDSGTWFNKPNILISYLVERFKKEPNTKPQYYEEFTEERKAREEMEDRELSQYFREGYKIGLSWEKWKEKMSKLS
jgi:hypothetical protein